jgi:signal transduction histidine kinase
MLPAIWAGLSLGPWTSAAYSLTGTLAVVMAQAIPGADGGYGGSDLSNILLLDSLMAAFVFVVLLLSLVRDQRAHLAGEVIRRRQEALDQAGLLGTVFESINEALVLMDTEGVVQLHNAAAVQILGREKLTAEPGRWLRRMTERPTFTYSYNRDGTDDGLRILAVQLAPVQYAGSDSVVAIVRDVTTEQARIEELASFAAVAAHDLKSPLAAVQGWIEVAEDAIESDPVLAQEALQRGRHATDRMTREIEDWLTYNVAREGVVQPESIALQPCLDAIAASHPDVDFTVRTPDTVMVDPTLLRHLLANLIGNAVKYTLPGERPSIAVRSFSGGDRGWVRLYVVDAGIGIPEGEETAIFEPFRRASTVQGSYEGSGLGLALCKRIVRRHGGLISAQRNEGPGTTITVTLPQG